MKANELRIKNLLKDKKGNIFKVESILTNGINLYEWSDSHHGVFSGGTELSYDYDELELIPLTEEWLLKFGFKKYNKETDYDSIYEYKNKKSIMPKSGYFEFAVGFIEDEINVFLYSGDCLKHIKYVHQLQNLYFALTNEELKLSE